MYNVENNNNNNLSIQTRRLSKSEGINKSVTIFEYYSNIIECSLHLGNNVAFADILTRQSNFRSSLTTLITHASSFQSLHTMTRLSRQLSVVAAAAVTTTLILSACLRQTSIEPITSSVNAYHCASFTLVGRT